MLCNSSERRSLSVQNLAAGVVRARTEEGKTRKSSLFYMQRLFLPLCRCERQEREEEGNTGEGGGDTSRADRKTGRRKWEMERKGGEGEQERAPLPSLNLSCSDQ